MKPRHWNLTPAEVDPRWRWVWRGVMYPFWERGGDIAKAYGDQAKAAGGDLDVSDAAMGWRVGKPGVGLGANNDQNQSTAPVIPNTPNPGWWHDSFDVFSMFMYIHVGGDAGGPIYWIREGGSGNGWAITYKTTPNTFQFTTWVSSTKVELNSTSTFLSTDTLTIGGTYNKGAMKLYINGMVEDSSSNGTSVGSHTDEAGIFGASTSGNFDEPGGEMFALYMCKGDVWNERQFAQLHADPFGPFRRARPHRGYLATVAAPAGGAPRHLLTLGVAA